MPEMSGAVRVFLDGYYHENEFLNSVLEFHGCTRRVRLGTEREAVRVKATGRRYAEAMREYREHAEDMEKLLPLCAPDWCGHLKGCG